MEATPETIRREGKEKAEKIPPIKNSFSKEQTHKKNTLRQTALHTEKQTKTTVSQTESGHQSRMRVHKRDGSTEPVDVTKIIERVAHCCAGLSEVDPLRVATKVISGLYDGASTQELDELSIQTASLLISDDPQYSKLAARLLNKYIEEELKQQKIRSFLDFVKLGV